MSEEEKELFDLMAGALNILPPDKRQYWLGYAVGVRDGAASQIKQSA